MLVRMLMNASKKVVYVEKQSNILIHKLIKKKILVE